MPGPKRPLTTRPTPVTKRGMQGQRGAIAGGVVGNAAANQRIVESAVNAGDRRPSMPKPMANYPRPGKSDRRGKGGM